MYRIYCIKFYNFKRGILLCSILAENLTDKILEFWNFGILEFWNFGILEFWNFGILEFWNFGILEFCGAKIYKQIKTRRGKSC